MPSRTARDLSLRRSEALPAGGCHSRGRVKHSESDEDSEESVDVGMMMVFASYGWENTADHRVWDEEISGG
jgi:hypothetical protein